MADIPVVSLAAIQANLKKSNLRQRRTDGTIISRPFPHAVYQKIHKNPTCHIPDIAGFSALNKSEVKKDLKDVEKSCLYACLSDSDSEKEADEEGLTLRCLRPGPTPEATLTVKKNRYVSWTADPAKVQRDIVSQQKSILGAKRQLSELGFQESHWRDCFEMARHRVNDSLLRVKEGNLSLNMVGKHIASIYASRRAGGQGRRLAATLKDFGTALEESKDEIEEALNLYLCSDSSETDASTATRTRCVDVELNDSDLEVNAPSKTASGSLSMRASPIDAAAESVAIKAEPSPNLVFPGNRVKIEGSSLLMAYPSSSLIEANSWVCANCGLHNHCDPNQSHSAFNIMSKDLDPARSRRVCVSCHQVGDTLDFDGRALDGDNGEKNYDDNGVLKPSKRPSSSSTAERMSLKQYMINFDNKALLRESNMTDLEAFFPEDDYSMYSEQPQQQPAQSSVHPVANMTASTDYNHTSMSLSPLAKQQPQSDHASNGSMFTGASITKIHLPNEGEMQVMAMPFIENIQINGSSSSEPYWRHCIEETCRFPSSASSAVTSTTLSLTRRRRRPQCSIPLASFVMPRTPRNVPLFISPLSHHPDKYIGAVLGDTFSSSTSFTNVNSAPFYVQRMESNALTRADIKGLVRIAERDCLVINSRIAHWETQGAEAQGALRKAEAALATVKAEQQAEMNRYKHGVEEPLAALPSTGVSSSGSGVDPAGGHLHEMFDDEGKESHPSSSPRVGTSKARRGLKNEAQKSSVTQVSDSMSAAPKGGSKEPASVEVSKRKTSTGAATTSAGTPALTEFSSVGGGGAGSKVVNKKHPTKR